MYKKAQKVGRGAMLSSDFYSRPVYNGGKGEYEEGSQYVPGGLCFVGIDPSFTNTGFVALDEEHKVLVSEVLHAHCPKDWRVRTNEIIKLQHGLADLLSRARPTCVVMEGQAYGTVFLTYAFGELGFAYHYVLLPYNTYIVPPTTIKKFISGSGRASKEEVAAAVEREVGLTFSNSHLSDACACAIAASVLSGHSQLGHPEVLNGQRTNMGNDNPSEPS